MFGFHFERRATVYDIANEMIQIGKKTVEVLQNHKASISMLIEINSALIKRIEELERKVNGTH